LTGGGASGTWGISITGNAATASSVPWSGITGRPDVVVNGDSSRSLHDIYNSGWFRNNDAGEGLYNQSTGLHFYSESSNYWTLHSNHGLILRNGYAGTPVGYLYWDGAAAGSNSFGLLSPGGNWRVRTSNTQVELYGSVLMPSFADSDNTGYLNPC